MKKVSLRKLLEAGAHFGHKVSRWQPQARKFIFESRDNIHIIDLLKTKEALEQAGEEVRRIGSRGGILLLVGTKRQAKAVLKKIAGNASLPYITERWIGGLITNWEEVQKNIAKMNKLQAEYKAGTWNILPKHERVKKYGALKKLQRVYEGLNGLTELPAALLIIDIRREQIAAREAKSAKLLSIGICDTNSNPHDVDLPIPANDDAVGSIKYITEYLVEAYMEGKKKHSKAEVN